MEERLNYLFLQYLNNTSSQKELEEFFEYIARTKTDNELRALIRKVYSEIKETHPSLTYVDGYGNLIFNEARPTDTKPLPGVHQKKKLVKALPIVLLVVLSIAAL